MNRVRQGGAAAVVSPEVGVDGRVTFRISAPDAREVALRGDWMNGYFSTAAMHKDANGVWSYTTAPLAPEMYQYSFNVDGVKTTDPGSLDVVRDGTRVDSYVIVPGERTAGYEEYSGNKGTVSKVWYHSPAYGADRRMYIYTPYGYEGGKAKYPVLYLQHGGGGDEDAWTSLGRAAQILDRLIGEGKAVPMIVVMPNANPNQLAAPDVMAPMPVERIPQGDPSFHRGGKYVESFSADIVPFVDSHYRTIAKKSGRAIAGLSMGGIYTLSITAAHPELCDYIGVLSMGFTPDKDPETELGPIKKAGYKLYWVGCGESDFAYGNAERLLEGLDKMNMPHEFFNEIGGHTWATWRICLDELAPKLFK
uniref:Carbohydrate esterase family 1 protein n=2 Tax=termite gut metagenome TaxID=433724 RepID=S0DES0_9ZZZZ